MSMLHVGGHDWRPNNCTEATRCQDTDVLRIGKDGARSDRTSYKVLILGWPGTNDESTAKARTPGS